MNKELIKKGFSEISDAELMSVDGGIAAPVVVAVLVVILLLASSTPAY